MKVRPLFISLFLTLVTQAVVALQRPPSSASSNKNRARNISSSPKRSSFDVVAAGGAQERSSTTKLSLSISPDSMLATSLRFAGPLMFTVMQLASVKTAYGIHKAKSTGNLSPLPFTSLVVNCFVWTLYGILRKDLTVLVPNAYGIVMGLIGVVTYQNYSQQLHTKLYTAAMIISATAYKLFLNKNPSRIGLIGCSLAVILSGSPLATVGTVLKDKSTAALPFLTSFATWLNAFCWLSYGILVAHDVMIFGPNGMGFALASIQMVMFVLFGLPPQ
mmetsp:Transcript_12371/g.18131  ORF Transcript_12371/g.18131 Transcript_12371/m.18131 type:complete len:275 (+) Transcript_12371:180-1004(+)|eukprot:CAMPEP_0194221184 /NCGR_PEP_ID=MMETSP0156-20130528/30073_1 /TAXON_ID=33649 /ORGANISM="Thalassionema nitzschioides, Strain L26-B" /LENGTH=274 /DNA_ID=CAMNT_0038951499 /DNA_START=103 /DNA_END=927 /DNA_ORIENTATION=-